MDTPFIHDIIIPSFSWLFEIFLHNRDNLKSICIFIPYIYLTQNYGPRHCRYYRKKSIFISSKLDTMFFIFRFHSDIRVSRRSGRPLPISKKVRVYRFPKKTAIPRAVDNFKIKHSYIEERRTKTHFAR